MPSDSKMAAPLDPAVLAALATKSQAAVQGFLVDRPDVANIGMGDPAKTNASAVVAATRSAVAACRRIALAIFIPAQFPAAGCGSNPQVPQS
jgi:hypothetical protein